MRSAGRAKSKEYRDPRPLSRVMHDAAFAGIATSSFKQRERIRSAAQRMWSELPITPDIDRFTVGAIEIDVEINSRALSAVEDGLRLEIAARAKTM